MSSMMTCVKILKHNTALNYVPVSYTHLDVYKRQEWERETMLEFKIIFNHIKNILLLDIWICSYFIICVFNCNFYNLEKNLGQSYDYVYILYIVWNNWQREVKWSDPKSSFLLTEPENGN